MLSHWINIKCICFFFLWIFFFLYQVEGGCEKEWKDLFSFCFICMCVYIIKYIAQLICEYIERLIERSYNGRLYIYVLSLLLFLYWHNMFAIINIYTGVISSYRSCNYVCVYIHIYKRIYKLLYLLKFYYCCDQRELPMGGLFSLEVKTIHV